MAEDYTCPNCGGRFRAGGESCTVAHPPRSCCHYSDTDLSTGQNARLHDPQGQGGVRYAGAPWAPVNPRTYPALQASLDALHRRLRG